MRCGGAFYRVALLFAALVLSGCATHSDSFYKIERSLAGRDYEAALETIEEQANSKTGRVLYLLDRGMVLRMQRDYVASNVALEAAKAEMERLYAESLSENALSFIVNDATISYAGDDYEQVLVHLYLALNYLELGQLTEARVEALQVDIKLRELGERIPDSKFTEDALSRYLTGLIYEELGEWSDAMIAYRKAYQAYEKYGVNYGVAMPEMLKHDLIRLSKRLGLKKEEARYRKAFDIRNDPEPVQEQGLTGELVFVLNNGLAPIKRERVVAATGPVSSVVIDSAGERAERYSAPVAIRIALPYYESRGNYVRKARIHIAGQQEDTQLMENIDAIARASLAARMPAITARSIGRAMSKVAIQKSVDRAGRNGDNDLAVELLGSLAVRVAAIVTERADTRSWLTLPAEVQLAKMAVPTGSYNVTMELLDEAEQVVEVREFQGVVIREGRKTYLTQHWIPLHAKPEGERR